jgi:hypothetical protein
MKTKTKDYWECIRCNSSSLNDKWCPCPRGSCEAQLKGVIETETKIILNETIKKA